MALGADTIVLAEDIHNFMCGSNFNETDVMLKKLGGGKHSSCPKSNWTESWNDEESIV